MGMRVLLTFRFPGYSSARVDGDDWGEEDGLVEGLETVKVVKVFSVSGSPREVYHADLECFFLNKENCYFIH
jgi:hypothetical protein